MTMVPPQSAADASPGPAVTAPIDSPTAVTAGTGTTSGATVFSGLTAPSGNMPANAPASFSNTKVSVSPGKTPDPGRLSDLMKIMHAIAIGHPLDGENPAALADMAKNAGLSPQAAAALKNGGGSPANKEAAIKAAWKGIQTQLVNLGIPSSALQRAGISTSPTVANAANKATEVAKLPLENTTLQYFKSQGVDITGVTNVDKLVGLHDGGVTLSGAVTQQGATLASQYDQFVTDWNSNDNNFRINQMQDLVGMGALDISNGTPTASQVAEAWQNVATYAAQNHMTIPGAMGVLEGGPPRGEPQGQVTLPGGGTQDINKENINQAEVFHLADQILGPGVMTSYQATTLANLASKAGTGSGAAQELLLSGVTSLFDPNNPHQVGEGSYAGEAVADVNTALAEWGIPTTPGLAGKLVQQVLQTGVDTPYQISSLAASAAQNYAKENVTALYGAGVGAAAANGVSVAAQAQPYLASASALLGTSVDEMRVNDPSGLWMKWASGGTGPGGTKTAQEWQQQVMTDPTFKFQGTQEAGKLDSSAGSFLLQLLGKQPSNLPSVATAPSQGGTPVSGG